jgi:STE24 endopeptidase
MCAPLILVLILLVHSIFEMTLDWLNWRRSSPEIPVGMAGLTTPERQARAHDYLSARTRLEMTAIATGWGLRAMLILGGAYAWADSSARSASENPILQGLTFFGLISVPPVLLGTAFAAASTFGIEARFGFNRTTVGTFLRDRWIGLLLGAVLGGAALAVLLGFLENAGPWAWLKAWTALAAFQIFLSFIAPVVILPLFNKYQPLPAGELRSAIETYARQEGFALSGMYLMDGSKRSSKANAFFTGFGKFRRLVLFDTLVEKLTPEQVVAVVAHEVGHFRLKHIQFGLSSSLVTSALGLWIAQQALGRPELSGMLGLENPSLYAGLATLSLLSGPILRPFSAVSHFISRKFEYDADRFASRTLGRSDTLAEGLKKMGIDHLAQLDPHPLRVWLDYTHPPLPARLQRLVSSSMIRATS